MLEKLSPREKKLAVIVAGLGGVFLLFMVWSYFYGSYTQQSRDFIALTTRQSDLEQNALKAKLASQRKMEYRELSLDPDPEVAKTKYNAWLLKTVAEFGLGTPTVTKTGPFEKKFQNNVIAYETRFTLNGEGNIKDLMKFLHHFHATRVLHRITDLSVKPVRSERRGSQNQTDDPNKLKINFTVEMLTTADATPTEEIVTDPALLQRDLDEYAKVILPRNMFGFPNNAPQFTTDETQEVEAGDKISFDVRAKDPDDGDELTYEMIKSDIVDAKLTSSSGRARFTAPSQEVGKYQFKFRVTDNHPDQKSSEIEVLLVVEEPEPELEPDKGPPPTPPFDPSSRTVVTAITRDLEGTDRVVISIKPTGDRLELTVNEEFQVGPHKGRVIEFTDGGVVIEVDEETVFFKTRDRFDKPRDLPTGFAVN